MYFPSLLLLFITDIIFCFCQVHKVSGGAGDPLPLHDGKSAVTPHPPETRVVYVFIYLSYLFSCCVLIDNKCEYLLRSSYM
jgi:hypothetical protein